VISINVEIKGAAKSHRYQELEFEFPVTEFKLKRQLAKS